MSKRELPYPIYCDLKTACYLFSVGKNTIYKWIDNGLLKYAVESSDKRSKKRFRTESILKLIQDREVSH